MEVVEKLVAAGRQRAHVDNAFSVGGNDFFTLSALLSNSMGPLSRFFTRMASGLLAGACGSAGSNLWSLTEITIAADSCADKLPAQIATTIAVQTIATNFIRIIVSRSFA